MTFAKVLRAALAACLISALAPFTARATVASTTAWAQYTYSGSTLPVTFVFTNSTDLLLLMTRGTAAPVILTLNSDYTVSGGSGSTGTVTISAGGAHGVVSGDVITVTRGVPLTQTATFSATGPFNPATIGLALDKLTEITQQQNLSNLNSLRFPKDEQTDGTLPLALRKGKYLGFDSNGNPAFLSATATGATDATLSTVTASGTTTARTLGVRFADEISVWDFGAAGDGVVDDTAAIQAALNLASSRGGGIVKLGVGTFLVGTLEIGSYVTLEGQFTRPQASSSNASILKKKNANGNVIQSATTYPSQTIGATVRNLMILGAGASYTGYGISFGPEADWANIEGVNVTEFAGAGIYLGGGAFIFKDSIVTRCVLDYSSLSAPTGAVIVAGSDHLISNVEVQTSLYQGATGTPPTNAITSANLYASAWLVSSAASFFTDCIGEKSDIGFTVRGFDGIGSKGSDPLWPGTQAGTQFQGCRADHNGGPGWFTFKSTRYCRFINCSSLSNCSGSNADGAFDSWVEGVTGVGMSDWNQYIGCTSDTALDTIAPYKPRYGFFSISSFGNAAGNQSHLVDFVSHNHLTRAFASSGTGLGGVDQVPWDIVPLVAPNWIEQDDTATPVISSTSGALNTRLAVAASSPTTITNFTGAVNDQELYVWFRNDSFTIANNSTIKLSSGRNEAVKAGDVKHFMIFGGVWQEVGPRHGYSGSATYDPPSLSDGDGATTTVTATGASLGDFVLISFSNDLQGVLLTGYVSSGDTVSARFQNETTGTVDLASGTLSVQVTRK